MRIYATLRHEVEISPTQVIDRLTTEFLGDHGRWVEKIGDRFLIMEDSYHNTTREVREISAEDVSYLDSLEIIFKYLRKHEE